MYLRFLRRYSVEAIGLALAVTCATVFGAFFVAAFTKMDLTKIGGFLTAILFGVIALFIIGFFWRNKCAASSTSPMLALQAPCPRLAGALLFTGTRD